MRKTFLTSAIVGLSAALPVSATTLGTWNLGNVAVGGVPADGETEVSTIFVDDTSTDSNGQIAYTAPEAQTPGLTALNDFYASGAGTFDGCIRAEVGGTDCATGYQTGNRFKLQLTETGAVDLVFNVDPAAAGTQGGMNTDGSFATPGTNTYQVFGRAVNLTGLELESFELQLGFGVGADFEASTAGDGLSFATGLTLGPENLDAFTQYPFGLFGDAPTQNADLDGFFNNGRSGFNVLFSEDSIASDGFYESILTELNQGRGYEDLFGNWLSREMAPAGLLWDNDNDEATDALVMAWQLENGTWEALRDIATLPTAGDPDNGVDPTAGTAVSKLLDPIPFANEAAAIEHFTDQGATVSTEPNIEDLANLNLNFGITLADTFMGWTDDLTGQTNTNFTLRLASVAAPVSPVPLPAGAPLLLAGVAMIGFLRKRRIS